MDIERKLTVKLVRGFLSSNFDATSENQAKKAENKNFHDSYEEVSQHPSKQCPPHVRDKIKTF